MDCPVTGGLLEPKASVFTGTVERQSGQGHLSPCSLSKDNAPGRAISQRPGVACLLYHLLLIIGIKICPTKVCQYEPYAK